MATKKKTCDRVLRGVAGPTPEEIMESIRAEFNLPRPKRRKNPSNASASASPAKERSKEKP